MSAYAGWEAMPAEQFRPILAKLGQLLENLPGELPLRSRNESKYATFLEFSLDPNLLDKTGCEISALSEQLKQVFGWQARSTGDGVIDICERGPGICALQGIFAHYFGLHPENNVLKKWIVDVTRGAEKVYQTYNVAISHSESTGVTASQPSVSNVQAQKRPRSESSGDALPLAKSTKTQQSKLASSSKGRKPDELLGRLAVRGEENGKAKWSCIAPGCDHMRFGNFQQSRIIGHAVKCPHLRDNVPKAYNDAVLVAKNGSLGSQIEADTKASSSASTAGATPHLADVPCAFIQPDFSGQSSQTKLNVGALQAAGQKAKQAERDKMQKRVDHCIMRLICVRNLIPNIIDSAEWKELMHELNPDYKSTSSDIFVEKYIPMEAVHVRSLQLDRLKQEENLTLTFDGTTIRKPESFYTAHATTTSRDSYLLDGHEGTGERHDKIWIMDKLLETIRDVGEDRWAAITSDSTNVTKAARRDLSQHLSALLDLCDCVHHIQLLIKDITKLDEFKPFISTLKGIIKHFSKSSYSVEKLRQQRNLAGDDEPVKALQKIGKTRFGTHWMASGSLDPVLRDIQAMVIGKVIKFSNTKVQGLFLGGRFSTKFIDFEQKLQWYIIIIAPLIRSLWSLEAAHANASDVFVFWLAIAATLKDLFSKETQTHIPRSFANKITDLFNKRYDEFFKNDIYFTAFMLDPRYRKEDFLKLTLNVPPLNDQGTSSASASAEPLNYNAAYKKVKAYLGNMLRGMLQWIEDHPGSGNALLISLGPKEAVSELKRQLEAYWRREYPFDMNTKGFDPNKHSLEWWNGLERHHHARVLATLAVRIFSTLVNSMPDERTNSTITWMNSPNRGCQTTRVLVDRIQVGQWYGKHANKSPKKTRYRPAVKFRKIEKSVLLKLQIDESEDREISNPDLNDDEATSGEADSDEGEDSQCARVTESTMDPVVAFGIDSNIDINSKALLDLVSEEEVVPEKPSERLATGKTPDLDDETVDDAFADF